tara:strand:- start:19 stop:534 length:516 start_codon:yes stop_codon:yes gene_type:complete
MMERFVGSVMTIRHARLMVVSPAWRAAVQDAPTRIPVRTMVDLVGSAIGETNLWSARKTAGSQVWRVVRQTAATPHPADMTEDSVGCAMTVQMIYVKISTVMTVMNAPKTNVIQRQGSASTLLSKAVAMRIRHHQEIVVLGILQNLPVEQHVQMIRLAGKFREMTTAAGHV